MDLGTFDAVLAANLLCRVPDPLACLQAIADVVKPGGLLVLTSPFTWLEEYTAKAKWVGGRANDDGKALQCADALKATMADLGFTVLEDGKVCQIFLVSLCVATLVPSPDVVRSSVAVVSRCLDSLPSRDCCLDNEVCCSTPCRLHFICVNDSDSCA